jgi:hypothetical protein
MNQPMHSFSSRRRRFTAGVAVVMVLIAAYFCWPAPNRRARLQVEDILLSDATQQEMVDRLEPYLKVGDRWSEVQRRILPIPNSGSRFERPTIMGVGLEGRASLVLCIQKDGTIYGIGGLPHGGRTTWLTEQHW